MSSTASLFETSLPSNDQLCLDGDALAWDRYLFPEGEAGAGSSTSDLFADINPSQLNLVANTNLSQDMDIIDGATLFKVWGKSVNTNNLKLGQMFLKFG